MSEGSLYKNMMLLGFGAEACIESKLYGPALILIYSAIDTVGWLDSPHRFATQDSFEKWVNGYLLRAKALPCTSLELYAARCGLLHTFTGDSGLSSSGKARGICYAWGTASADDLRRVLDELGKSEEYVAVHANDLYEAWKLGLTQFMADLEKDASRKAGVCRKANRFFVGMGLERVSNIISWLDGKGGP